MSHFVGIVVGEDYEEQIEPFWELDLSTEDRKLDERAEFDCEIEAENIRPKCLEIIGEYQKKEVEVGEKIQKAITHLKKKEYIETLKCFWADWKIENVKEKTQEELAKLASEEFDTAFKAYLEDSTVDNFMKALSKNDFETILSEYYGGGFDDNGNWGNWYNPNAKWDWMSVGGRWKGFFKLKPGAPGELGETSWASEPDKNFEGKADIAKVKDIDWEGMNAEYLARAKKWWKQYEEKVKKGEIKEGQGDYMTGVQEGDTKEGYLAREGKFSPFCVVKDQEWYQRGDMGWWGITSNEKGVDEWVEEWQKLILELDPETTLTAVDFHI